MSAILPAHTKSARKGALELGLVYNQSLLTRRLVAMVDAESRGSSGHSHQQPDISHLTTAQQAKLEPEIQRLAMLCKGGCALACCTCFLSFVPYWLYSRRVLALIRRFERENRLAKSCAMDHGLDAPPSVGLA